MCFKGLSCSSVSLHYTLQPDPLAPISLASLLLSVLSSCPPHLPHWFCLCVADWAKGLFCINPHLKKDIKKCRNKAVILCHVFLKLTKFSLFFISLLKSSKNLIKDKLSGTIELANCYFWGMQLIWARPIFIEFYCLLYKYMPFFPFKMATVLLTASMSSLGTREMCSLCLELNCMCCWVESRGVKAFRTDDQQTRGLGLVEEDIESSFYEDCSIKT